MNHKPFWTLAYVPFRVSIKGDLFLRTSSKNNSTHCFKIYMVHYLLKFYYPHNSNDLNIKFRPAIELNLNEYLYPFISHFIFLSAYGQEHFLEKLLFEFSIFLIVTFQISLNSPRVKLNGNAVCKVCQFTQHKPLSARLRFSSSFILTIFVKMAGSIIRFRMNSVVYSFNIA